MKKTKIICTIGPSSHDLETLTRLAQEGMDVARLNFSHGDHGEKLEIIRRVRKVSEKLNKPIAILADIQGPKLRLGEIEGVREIRRDDTVILSTEPQKNDFPIQFDLSDMVQEGQRIFLNDGLVELVVQKIEGKRIVCDAMNEGWVSSHKGVNIPDTHFSQDVFTEKDHKDVVFAIESGVEYFALSFIQSADEVVRIKKFIKQNEGKQKVCVKIEKKEAIDNIEKIVDVSDVVMIARGDLAIETSAESVPVLQRKIVELCRKHQVPVVVATQMLESMMDNPRPTRAETSDVGHAVMSQVDAVMLSGESAAGKYPVHAVRVMKSVITSVENAPEYRQHVGVMWESIDPRLLQANSITAAAESLSYHVHAPVLAVASATGSTATSIASFRPAATIVAVTHDHFTQRQLNLVWGLYPVIVEPTKTSDAFWKAVGKEVLAKKHGKRGETIVMVGGGVVGVSGATDTIKVLKL